MKILKEKSLNKETYILLNKSVLKCIPEGKSDFASEIFPKLIKHEKVYGYYEEDYYHKGIGQLEKYNLAKE